MGSWRKSRGDRGWQKAWLLAVLPVVAGCSRPELLPVSGVVTLGGRPLAGAQVLFMPARGGRPASGPTDDQGRFQLGTYRDADGVAPGEHAVAISLYRTRPLRRPLDFASPQAGLADLPRTSTQAPEFAKESVVPERYSDLQKSGLRAVVSAQQSTFSFDLTTP